MKLRRTPLLRVGFALVAVGCDPAPGIGVDSGDSGVTFAVQSIQSMATQVGSEGFWDCPIEEMRPVSGAETVDALGGTPAELTAARVGDWPLSILETGKVDPIVGLLSLTDGGVYQLVDVTESATCADHLVASVLGTLTRDAAPRSVVGLLAVSPTATRLTLYDDGDLASVAASWGTPTLPGAVALRVDADLDPVALSGSAAYVDCTDPMDGCPSAEVLATLDGAR